MTRYLFAPPEPPCVAIHGEEALVPLHRVYCVAQNYVSHAREMGRDPRRELPTFFLKPADTVVPAQGVIPFPPATAELHHEVELVLLLGGGGQNVSPAAAHALIWGYAVGLDLTRRDLQRRAREARGPWDVAKVFEAAAPVTAIRRSTSVGHPRTGRIWLAVNDVLCQEADLGEMIWSASEVIAELSRLFRLAAGDLVFTGTPAGVGRIVVGDVIQAGVEGVGELQVSLGPGVEIDRA